MNRRLEVLKYLFTDYLSSALAWLIFFSFRKLYIEYPFTVSVTEFFSNTRFLLGITFIPVGWVILYAIQGLYHNLFRKSRLKELAQVFVTCVLGCLTIFFLFLLDDQNHHQYKAYYSTLLFLFATQFTLNAIPRYLITTISARKIHKKKIGFNTLMIGANSKALDLFNELENAKKSAGYKFVGFVTTQETHENPVLETQLKNLGLSTELPSIIKQYAIEEVIIALDSKEHETIQQVILQLQRCDVNIKIIPDAFNILTGQVKMGSILHAALIEVTTGKIATWQAVAKRLLDVLLSALVLLLCTPLYLLLAILVKASSKGPVFFTQERVGLRGVPFNIIKFRSMYIDAEKNGPALSKDDDKRITPIGKFLRKTRLDETPQFFNVLIGEMSLVGPRPERQFFIDQIVVKAPQYYYLQKVKPGITSWGQVKYGYAENVDEMIERLKFDLIYMENRSLLIDFKIMIHTVLVVFQGRGK